MDEGADRELLRRYVTASPLSQNQIGKRVGVTGTMIGNYMRGHDNRGGTISLSAARLAQLANVLGISDRELTVAGRADAAAYLNDIGRIESGKFTERLVKLRDQLDALVSESRRRGL